MHKFLLVQQDRHNENNMKIRTWTVLWTTIRNVKNHCQDVDHCRDEDHCQYYLGIDHCQTGNCCRDREHCQNGMSTQMIIVVCPEI